MGFIKKNIHYIIIALLFCVVFCFIFSTIKLSEIIKQQSVTIVEQKSTIAEQYKVIRENDSAIEKYKKKESATKEQLHKIDKIERECLKNPQTTADMLNCVGTAHNAWNKEIDKYMFLLKKELPKERYQALEISQKKWKDYYIAESKVIGEIIYAMQGTMYLPIGAGMKLDIAKQRALSLEEYYRDITSFYQN